MIEVVEYDPAWPAVFGQLSDRVTETLGPLCQYVEHVGGTAVPGLAAKPIIDLIVVIAPGDLPAVTDRLRPLGYRPEGDLGVLGREAFTTPPDTPPHHLYVCVSGAEELTRQVAFRQYLRTHADVAAEYATLKRSLTAQGKDAFVRRVLAAALAPGCYAPDVTAWDAWHPTTAAERLAGLPVPWYVASGWALDLFRGEQTREHGDLEIAVPRDRFGILRERLADLDFVVIGSGLAYPEAMVDDDALADEHQTWAREPATGKWRVDVFREPSDGDLWICRRDLTIRRPYTEIIVHTSDGVPYVRPEIALLFKAKGMRRKDEDDFAGVLPLLDGDQRHWLAQALTRVHPGHAWLATLAD